MGPGVVNLGNKLIYALSDLASPCRAILSKGKTQGGFCFKAPHWLLRENRTTEGQAVIHTAVLEQLKHAFFRLDDIHFEQMGNGLECEALTRDRDSMASLGRLTT